MAEALFAKVPPELDFPKEEREIFRFWQQRGIFEKAVAKPSSRGNFVFYEGPPTANGLPHNGHVLTRVIKDIFPRYKTMRGWSVPRKAGWDTHGLPVEVEVEKELRLHGKAAIEAYGVEPFVKKCIESVFRYTREWEELTQRVAFWVDLKDAYVTYHRSYVESVWWALSQLFSKGLLYQGHKVVWWWAQGGTALSSAEVGLGYRSVEDPSVYVAFPMVGEKKRELVGEEKLELLVWTTTPWTLPSNMFVAVHPNIEYVVARAPDGRQFILAEALRSTLEERIGPLTKQRSFKGAELQDCVYQPPFDLYSKYLHEDFVKRTRKSDGQTVQAFWRVVTADFVTLDAGTGIVHVAPAFGEDDHRLFQKERERLRDSASQGPLLPLNAVDPDGTFVNRFERYAGRWVKDCDKEIQHDLKDRNLLVHAEQYRHDYPFCWRAESDPLIQYARPAWYIRTTALIDRAIANNRAVHWLPEHIKEGRFGDFLANNVDWALSRERWWGTPLNVWLCDLEPKREGVPQTHIEAPASMTEIESKNPRAFDQFNAARRADPSLSEHLVVHKPWIDQVTFPCARCGGTMRRVPEVIDGWFDSGCMPFAQWGYPHAPGSKDRFAANFPADFISEAIDQTRGWFYSLLMISTLVHDEQPLPHPFKTCIVLGHVSDKEGKKESKSKGNYTPPEIILDKVAMQFAVVDDGIGKRGVALVGRDDVEGLDLQEGAPVRVYRSDAPHRVLDLAIEVSKKLRRRLVVLHPDDRAALGVLPTSAADVLPVAVPRLPPEERVVVEDPSTPAPGADAFRWFFYAASPPWSATRHSLSNVRALQKEFAIKLRNVYSFFTIYADIDGFDPKCESSIVDADRLELERWILGELSMTMREVTARMDEYDVYAATQRLVAFVDALSNWYVRLSRRLFWKGTKIDDADKLSAYETLYRCLVSLTKLTAPFTPYAAEAMYQNLVVRPGIPGARESVHLEDWPEVAWVTERQWAEMETLSNKVAVVRALASLGLQVRNQAKIKVRQPLSEAHVITAHLEALDGSAERQLSREWNVGKTNVVPLSQADGYVEFRVKPNFRSLGQRGLGKEAQALKRKMASMHSSEAANVASRLMTGGTVALDGVDLRRNDVEIEFVAKEGFAAAGERVGVVVLDTRIDERLREQGLLHELINRIQTMRKEMGLEYTDRIRVSVLGSGQVPRVARKFSDLLAEEVLAVHVSTTESVSGGEVREVDVEGETVSLGVALAPFFSPR